MARTKFLLFAAATFAALSPAFADMGGGGGGGASMPSSSGPGLNAAKEFQKALDLLKAGNYKGANSAIQNVLDVAPRNFSALVVSGLANYGLKDYSQARSAYSKALTVDSKNLLARRGLALSLVGLGEKDAAAKELTTLKERATACADTCPEAADIKSAIAAVEAASAAPQKQSREETSHSLMFADARSGNRAYGQAVAQINEHRYGDALKSFQAAERSFGPHPDVLTYIGYSYRKLGQYDRAENYYRQALAVAPEHRGATEYYGELKVERGDIAGARKMLARLESLCSFGCVEAEDLRRWIAKGHE